MTKAKTDNPTRPQCMGEKYDTLSRRFFLCTNPGKVQHGGVWYCNVHDPDKVAERKRAKELKWKQEEDASRARYEKERTTKRIGELMQKLSLTHPVEIQFFADGSVGVYRRAVYMNDGATLLDALEQWDSEQ